MQTQIDCGVFEALWNPNTQDYLSIIFRSPNSDSTSFALTSRTGEREISFYLSCPESNCKKCLRKSPSSHFPEDRDVPEASRYLEDF